MIDLVKKAMFTGLGMVSLTKEKVEEIANDFVVKGKMSEQEGKKLVEELMERSEKTKDDLKKQVEKVVQETMSKMDIVSKSDISELKKELLEIKAEMAKDN